MKTIPAVAAALLLTAAWTVPAGAAPAQAPFDRAGRMPRAPVARCFAPQGETIPAQKILSMLAEGKDVDLQGRIIEGSLDADTLMAAATDDRKTALRVVQGRFRLNSCRIMGRVAFPKTVLMQGIDLTCSEVLGEVDLSDADIRGGILGERAKIGGELRLTRAMVDGDIQMRGAEIDDRLEMSGARASLLAIAEGDIHRDVDLAHTVLIVVNFSGAKIGGAMKIQDALILRSFIANGASFGRGFSLESARVCGVMDLSEAGGPPATGVAAGGDAGDPPLTPGVFSISDLTVDGQLMVPLAGGSALTMAGVTVAQGFVLLDGTFGDSSLTGIRVTGGDCSLDGAQFLGKLLIGESDFGKRFSATEALFKGDVEFRRVRFPGDDPMQGATFARAPTLTETTLPKPPTVKDEQDEEQAPDEGDDDDSDGQ